MPCLRALSLVVLAVATSPRQENVALPQAHVAARLACRGHVAKPKQPFRCEVFLVADSATGTALIPRVLTPFEVPTRPPALVQFFTERGGRLEELKIAPGALRGRYDMAPMTAGDFSTLRPRALMGWSYDLNGEDWLLPDSSGSYLVRAKITLRLQTENGGWHRAVLDALGAFKEQASRVVASGVFWTNGEVITVER